MHTDEHGFIGEGLSGAARGRGRKVGGVVWRRRDVGGCRFNWGRVELRGAGRGEGSLGVWPQGDKDEHGFIGEGLSGAARGRWRKVWGFGHRCTQMNTDLL